MVSDYLIIQLNCLEYNYYYLSYYYSFIQLIYFITIYEISNCLENDQKDLNY
jgi:hypothetical protein